MKTSWLLSTLKVGTRKAHLEREALKKINKLELLQSQAPAEGVSRGVECSRARSMEQGAWSMEHGARSKEYGVRNEQ